MAFKVVIGKEGLSYSWQADFPEESSCDNCGGDARIAFVVFEDRPEEKVIKDTKYVCQLHHNEPQKEGYWPHDCIAVAVYLCKKCLKPKALFNQA